MTDPHSLRSDILALVREFQDRRAAAAPEFRPGVDPVRYAGRVFDADEVEHLVDASSTSG